MFISVECNIKNDSDVMYVNHITRQCDFMISTKCCEQSDMLSNKYSGVLVVQLNCFTNQTSEHPFVS